MGNRKVKNLTDGLRKQEMSDIFKEFYKLKELLNKTEWYAQSFIIVRLVTIIEQFFRRAIVIQLEKRKMDPPSEITLRTDDLNAVMLTRPAIVISASYNIQSVKAITDILSNFKSTKLRQCQKQKIELEKFLEKFSEKFTSLFDLRHEIVHTVSLSEANLHEYHALTEKLMQCVFCVLYDNDSHFYFSKATALAQLNKYVDALIWYDKVKRADVRSADLDYNIGNSLSALGKHEEAIGCYDEAIRKDPSSGVYNNKGVSLAALSKHEEAIGCYDEAIRMDTDNVNAYYNKGNSLSALGKHEEAIGCYDEEIRKDPSSGVYNNKGISLAALGKHEEAIGCYDEAIRMDPDNVNAYNNKGVLLAALGKHEEAIGCYDEVIRKDPSSGVYNNKGISLAALGKYEDAIGCYDEAIRMNPDNSQARLNKRDAFSTLDKNVK